MSEKHKTLVRTRPEPKTNAPLMRPGISLAPVGSQDAPQDSDKNINCRYCGAPIGKGKEIK